LRPITLWPFPKDELIKLSKTCKSFLSVELNMGQMVEDVKLSINCSKPVYFYGRTGGVIMTPDEVLNEIIKINNGEAKQW
ncbi:MAG: 3-methyl-2-oxobutanoate dehydrogenase subunit beta, partial [Clostridia bacterium]|nr:3-methyl-2-oxobutanoate dehydrogenase subunit beta [Clostridia bacterium]